MGIIKQLPEDIAIKIAAGEVVERPASVIKELVENSLDAGSTRIEVAIKDGGKTLIEIKDNGSGMDKEDAVNAFLRHGTSKIRQAEDLSHITTLGFRGEALAAIAASAEGELVTTQPDANEGTNVAFTYGHIANPRPHAPLHGTFIRIQNLFAALPARQKFLKSDVTEWKACLDVLSKQIIAHPEVAFIIKHNDRIVFELAGDQSFKERVSELWKVDPSKLIEVDIEAPHMSMKGVLVKPEVAHEGRGKQFFAVNGHPVNDKMVVRSIRDAYGTLLPPSIYPSFALNLTIHPGVVDVNIHPRKDEVRFVNPQDVYRFVLQSVSQSLEGVELAFTETPLFIPKSNFPVDSSFSRSSTPVRSFFPDEHDTHYSSRQAALPRPTSSILPLVTSAALVHDEKSSDITPVQEVQYKTLIIDDTYVLADYKGSLMIIDQHAAHERMLYHQLWQQEQMKAPARQPLLLPSQLDLNESEVALVAERQKEFESLGFRFSQNDEAWVLTEVPQLLKQQGPNTFFHSLLSGLEDRHDPELKDFKHKLFATMACKAAIKAGDMLTEQEIQRLITDLMALPDRFTCPHGRPSHILISINQLETLFKRTGF